MNIRSAFSKRSSVTSGPATAVVGPVAAKTMMTCEDCDLTGGPFEAAEAAHLRAVHDRLFHGFGSAA